MGSNRRSRFAVAVVAAAVWTALAPAAARPSALPSFSYSYAAAQTRVTVTQHWEGTGPLPGDTYVGTEEHSARPDPKSSVHRAVGGLNHTRGRPAASGGALAIPVRTRVWRDETVTRADAQGGAERCSVSPLEAREKLRIRLSVEARTRQVAVRLRAPPWLVSLGLGGCPAPTSVDPLDVVTRVAAGRFSQRRFVLVLAGRTVTRVSDPVDARRRLTSTLSWSVRVTLARLAGYPVRGLR
jgi:hypothetical protein